MNSFEEQLKQLKMLVETARAIISGQIDIIEGCRLIHSLWIELGLEENDDYYFFVAIDSETDSFPKGADVRKNFAPEYLKNMDTEEKAYLEKTDDSIKAICQTLINKYSI